VEEVQQILNVRGPSGIQATDPVWLSSFSINEMCTDYFRHLYQFGGLRDFPDFLRTIAMQRFMPAAMRASIDALKSHLQLDSKCSRLKRG